MRNISLLSHDEHRTAHKGVITATTFDLETKQLYYASESTNGSGFVEILVRCRDDDVESYILRVSQG